ncbi:hypothetical protein RQP46_001510 [Phenoliferia psychrophenolica]
MRFPPEVVSLIVDQVRRCTREDRLRDGHDRVCGPVNSATLRCSLVCREWAGVGIPLLYFPHLQVEWSAFSGEGLVRALQASPQYLPLIRRVDCRYQGLEELGDRWVKRGIARGDEELRLKWVGVAEKVGVDAGDREAFEDWAQLELRARWASMVAGHDPETIWTASDTGIASGSAAFWAFLSLLVRLRHLSLANFVHGPILPDGETNPITPHLRRVLSNLKIVEILGEPLKFRRSVIGRLEDDLLLATPKLETLSLSDVVTPMWRDPTGPPQLPLLRHLSIRILTPTIFDLIKNSGAPLETLVYRQRFETFREPTPALTTLLRVHSVTLHTLELPTRRPLDLNGPWPQSNLNAGPNRTAWDPRPLEVTLLETLRTSSIRHFSIGEPLTYQIISFLPATLETVNFRIRTREPDVLDLLILALLGEKKIGKLPLLVKVAYEQPDESRETPMRGVGENFVVGPPTTVSLAQEAVRTKGRIEFAAKSNVVLDANPF